jgi:hypothetical protein
MSAAITIGALLIVVSTPSIRGHRFMNELGQVMVGQTTDSDLLNRPYFRDAVKKCVDNKCSYAVWIDNHSLATLHLAPLSQIIASVNLENGVVAEVLIYGIVVRHNNAEIWITWQQMVHAPGCEQSPCARFRRRNDSGSDLWAATLIYGGPGNHLGNAINVNCLSRIGGCKDAAEFMPLISNYRQ